MLEDKIEVVVKETVEITTKYDFSVPAKKTEKEHMACPFCGELMEIAYRAGYSVDTVSRLSANMRGPRVAIPPLLLPYVDCEHCEEYVEEFVKDEYRERGFKIYIGRMGLRPEEEVLALKRGDMDEEDLSSRSVAILHERGNKKVETTSNTKTTAVVQVVRPDEKELSGQ